MSKRKNLKWVVWIIVAIPVLFYVVHFWGCRISNNPSDWAAFGDYIGGTYSIIVTIGVVFLARDLAKKDNMRNKQKEAVDELYQQILKVDIKKVDIRSVNKIFNLCEKNRLYIPDPVYQEVIRLANYFLEVKGGKETEDSVRVNQVKNHLKSLYEA